MVIIDLCKTLPGAFPAVVAGAVRALFDKVGELDMEAKSLGVGVVNKGHDKVPDCWQCWEAFILLYEMLEEYGTHLVEAAGAHQISLLLPIIEGWSPEIQHAVIWDH